MKHACGGHPGLGGRIALGLAATALAVTVRADASATPGTDPFARDSARAMDTMMQAMSVPPSGDTDRDFVATMVPHHRGAIAMALAELRYGKDETLRRMAQEIIVEQRQEIDAMTLAVDRLPVSRATSIPSAEICTRKSPPPPTHDAVVPEGH